MAEPRHHGAGTVSTEGQLSENLKEILSGFAGKAILSGGLWSLLAPTYNTPTVYINEDTIISTITVQTRLPKRDRFNVIKGVYTAQINDFQPSDYPSLTDNTGITDDLERLEFDYDLNFTDRPYTAQRIAKIELKKARQQIVVKFRCTLHAMQLQVGSTCYLSLERMGWINKVFEVTEFRFVLLGDENSPYLGVELSLRETAS